MRSALIVQILVLLAVLSMAGMASSSVPQMISYQGRLLDSSGKPVADGSYGLRFYLYDAASGGSLLWQEPASGQPALQAAVKNGVFSVGLGSVVPLTPSAFAGSSWLQVEVNGSVLPRTQIVSSGYAIHALSADGIPDGSVTGLKIAAGAVSPDKLNTAGATSGQVLTFNGSAAAWMNSSSSSLLALPYAGGVNSASVAFSITNTGTGGAASFTLDNPTASYVGAITGIAGPLCGDSTGGVMGVHQASSTMGALGTDYSGVYGGAGADGTVAGYFDGKVEIDGELSIDGTLGGPHGLTVTNDATFNAGLRVKGIHLYGPSFDAQPSCLTLDGQLWVNGNEMGACPSSRPDGFPTLIVNKDIVGIQGDLSASHDVFVANDLHALHNSYVTGDLNVYGTLNAATKHFRIDHPLEPANKYLVHASVESSEMSNLYTGNVTLDRRGEARVQMPEWFEALNGDFRYQLTCIGGFAPVFIAQEMRGNCFRIGGGKPGMKVSWQVTGIRKDPWAKAHPLQVEQLKDQSEQGLYMHPDLYGQTQDKTVGAGKQRAPVRQGSAR